MKSRSIPSLEESHLISWVRAEDILTGPLQKLYFNITYIGRFTCKASFSTVRKNMRSVQLLIPTEGEAKLNYQGKEYSLTPGCVMLINNMNLHEYHAMTDNWTFKFCHFRGALSEEYCDYINKIYGPVLLLDDCSLFEIEKNFEELLQITCEDVIPDYTIISHKLYTILMILLSPKNHIELSMRSTTAVQEAAKYIVNNYHQNITTQDISNAVYLSRSYMSEKFSQTYGMSPHEYLTMYRINRAKRDLRDTSESISEIALKNGFRDIFTMSRVFKRKIGLSPSEYRKRVTKD